MLRDDVKETEEGRITPKRPNEAMIDPEEAERGKWRKFVAEHKRYVAYILRLGLLFNVVT